MLRLAGTAEPKVYMKKLLFLLFLLPGAVKAQKNFSSQMDSFMQVEVSVNKFNGNVLVAKSGNIIYQKSFGYRNYNTKELLDNNSVFELASISKQFTAMGILLLKEKGKLTLSDSLRKFFPELPYSNITIKNLLVHTSGLPEGYEIMDTIWDHKKIAFNNDLIKALAKEKVPLKFKPGEKWEYSNTGYELLASIIEKVTGESFKDYMYKNIFKPLGMTHSRVYNTRRSLKETIPDYAYGFVYSDSLNRYILPDSVPGFEDVFYFDGLQGDAAINSTTGDLLKWDRALKNHTLLSAALQEEMLSPQYPFWGGNYGYGVMLDKDELGDFIRHTGSLSGYLTYMIRYSKEDITIIVLSNNFGESGPVTNGLAYILFNKPFIYPYVHQQVEADTLLFGKLTGPINIPYIGFGHILKKNGKLFICRDKKKDIELRPESAHKFFYHDPVNKTDAVFEFELDELGNVNKIYHTIAGKRNEIKRL